MEIFASDLHLHQDQPGITALFLKFLRGPVRQASRLTLLGDLLDAWPGDDGLSLPYPQTICDALAEVSQAGIELRFLPGNRDFLVGPAFAQRCGLTLLEDPSVHTVQGHPTLLMHGDLLCTDDHEYLRFREQVRNPQWQAGFLAQPLSQRLSIIEGLRQHSEMAKRDKDQALIDAHPQAIADAFDQHGVCRLIHGHTHREARHDYIRPGQADCVRYVLGDWHDQAGTYLVCDGDDWHFVHFN